MKGKPLAIMIANVNGPEYEEWTNPRPERPRRKVHSAQPASKQTVDVDVEPLPEQPPSEQHLTSNAGASGTAPKAAPEDLVLQARIVDEPGDLTASSAEAPTCQSSPAADSVANSAGLTAEDLTQQNGGPSEQEYLPDNSDDTNLVADVSQSTAHVAAEDLTQQNGGPSEQEYLPDNSDDTNLVADVSQSTAHVAAEDLTQQTGGPSEQERLTDTSDDTGLVADTSQSTSHVAAEDLTQQTGGPSEQECLTDTSDDTGRVADTSQPTSHAATEQGVLQEPEEVVASEHARDTQQADAAELAGQSIGSSAAESAGPDWRDPPVARQKAAKSSDPDLNRLHPEHEAWFQAGFEAGYRAALNQQAPAGFHAGYQRALETASGKLLSEWQSAQSKHGRGSAKQLASEPVNSQDELQHAAASAADAGAEASEPSQTSSLYFADLAPDEEDLAYQAGWMDAEAAAAASHEPDDSFRALDLPHDVETSPHALNAEATAAVKHPFWTEADPRKYSAFEAALEAFDMPSYHLNKAASAQPMTDCPPGKRMAAAKHASPQQSESSEASPVASPDAFGQAGASSQAAAEATPAAPSQSRWPTEAAAEATPAPASGRRFMVRTPEGGTLLSQKLAGALETRNLPKDEKTKAQRKKGKGSARGHAVMSMPRPVHVRPPIRSNPGAGFARPI